MQLLLARLRLKTLQPKQTPRQLPMMLLAAALLQKAATLKVAVPLQKAAVPLLKVAVPPKVAAPLQSAKLPKLHAYA